MSASRGERGSPKMRAKSKTFNRSKANETQTLHSDGPQDSDQRVSNSMSTMRCRPSFNSITKRWVSRLPGSSHNQITETASSKPDVQRPPSSVNDKTKLAKKQLHHNPELHRITRSRSVGHPQIIAGKHLKIAAQVEQHNSRISAVKLKDVESPKTLPSNKLEQLRTVEHSPCVKRFQVPRSKSVAYSCSKLESSDSLKILNCTKMLKDKRSRFDVHQKISLNTECEHSCLDKASGLSTTTDAAHTKSDQYKYSYVTETGVKSKLSPHLKSASINEVDGSKHKAPSNNFKKLKPAGHKKGKARKAKHSLSVKDMRVTRSSVGTHRETTDSDEESSQLNDSSEYVQYKISHTSQTKQTLSGDMENTDESNKVSLKSKQLRKSNITEHLNTALDYPFNRIKKGRRVSSRKQSIIQESQAIALEKLFQSKTACSSDCNVVLEEKADGDTAEDDPQCHTYDTECPGNIDGSSSTCTSDLLKDSFLNTVKMDSSFVNRTVSRSVGPHRGKKSISSTYNQTYRKTCRPPSCDSACQTDFNISLENGKVFNKAALVSIANDGSVKTSANRVNVQDDSVADYCENLNMSRAGCSRTVTSSRVNKMKERTCFEDTPIKMAVNMEEQKLYESHKHGMKIMSSKLLGDNSESEQEESERVSDENLPSNNIYCELHTSSLDSDNESHESSRDSDKGCESSRDSHMGCESSRDSDKGCESSRNCDKSNESSLDSDDSQCSLLEYANCRRLSHDPSTQDKPLFQTRTSTQDKPLFQTTTSTQDKPLFQTTTSTQDKPLFQTTTSTQDKPLFQTMTTGLHRQKQKQTYCFKDTIKYTDGQRRSNRSYYGQQLRGSSGWEECLRQHPIKTKRLQVGCDEEFEKHRQGSGNRDFSEHTGDHHGQITDCLESKISKHSAKKRKADEMTVEKYDQENNSVSESKVKKRKTKVIVLENDQQMNSFTENEDNYGKLVWAQLTGEKWWPGIIIKGSQVYLESDNLNMSWIFWFGDHKVSQISHEKIIPFSDGYSSKFNNKVKKPVIEALQECWRRNDYPSGLESEEALLRFADGGFMVTEDSENWSFEPIPGNPLPDYILVRLKQIGEEIRARVASRKAYVVETDNSDLVQAIRSKEKKITDVCISCLDLDAQVDCEHPMFEGGLCQQCKDLIMETCYAFGEDGLHAYCAVCGNGGKLFICDSVSCNKVYCFSCIEDLCGPDICTNIKDSKSWMCFLCSSFSLSTHGMLQPKSDWDQNIVSFFDSSPTIERPKLELFKEKRPIRVLSLFDGIGTCKLALDELGVQVEVYYSSEVDKDALMVTRANHGDAIIQIGDVQLLNYKSQLPQIGPVDLLIGGSPCNDFSIANPNRKGFGGSGVLFFDFFRVMKYLQLTYKDRHLFWIYENVASMKTEYMAHISRFLDCRPALWDSKYFAAQHRARYFWGNIPGLYSTPQVSTHLHKSVSLNSSLESKCNRQAVIAKLRTVTTRSNSLKCGKKDECFPIQMDGVDDGIWIPELERVFGFPSHYTDVGNLPTTRRQKLIGKSWCLPVIKHILSPLKEYFTVQEKS